MQAFTFIAAALVLFVASCEEDEGNGLPIDGVTSQVSIKRIAESQDMSVDEVTEIFQKCVDEGGKPIIGGFGQPACEKSTSDAGQSCTKDADCEGFCLAETMSCAPRSPMFGCFDTLPEEGRKVTLCVD